LSSLGILPDGLVIEDDAGNAVAHRLARAEQHFPVVAPAFLGRFHLDGVEPLLDRAGGLVGGKDALAARDHGERNLVEFAEIHPDLLRCLCPAK
jgi:hypothetical protein